MSYLAVTVVGHDRPGIIAQTADVLADAGMNLLDSSMTLLHGHFAMTLVCLGESDADDVSAALGPLRHDGLDVTVHEVSPEEERPPGGSAYLLTVHGADRLGIVAGLTATLAEYAGNVTDLTTRLSGSLYVLAAEVDLPPEADVAGLGRDLEGVAAALGVGVSLRPLERDEL